MLKSLIKIIVILLAAGLVSAALYLVVNNTTGPGLVTGNGFGEFEGGSPSDQLSVTTSNGEGLHNRNRGEGGFGRHAGRGGDGERSAIFGGAIWVNMAQVALVILVIVLIQKAMKHISGKQHSQKQQPVE